MNVCIEQDELYPVYRVFTEPCPKEEGADRLEVELPEEVIERHTGARRAFLEPLAAMYDIVGPVKEKADWPKWPFCASKYRVWLDGR